MHRPGDVVNRAPSTADQRPPKRTRRLIGDGRPAGKVNTRPRERQRHHHDGRAPRPHEARGVDEGWTTACWRMETTQP